MLKLISLLTILLSLSSCFKTAEEIRREKQIDEQLEQSSKIIANLTSQIHELKGNLATTSGQLEEIDYKNSQNKEVQSQTMTQRIDQLNAQIEVLMTENKIQKEQISSLQSELNSQKDYIKNVTGTLSKMSSSSGSTRSSGTSLLKKAHSAFEKNKQSEAKKLYLQVLSEGKVNNATKNHVYYNLGLLSYWGKKYDEGLSYFSKIYTKYPKSFFAPKALYYIGLSFKKTNKMDEAKATFSELIKNYPKSSQAKKAKKEKL